MNNEKLESNALIDWLSVTFTGENELTYQQVMKYNNHFKNLISIIGLNPDLYFRKNGNDGFRDSVCFGEKIIFRFFASADEEFKNYHQMYLSGSALRELEDYNVNFQKLYIYILENDLKVTRIDPAIDVFTDKYFTVKDLAIKTMKFEYWSIPHIQHIIFKANSKSETTQGTTIYLGSPGSDRLCIYDKKSERYYHGFNVDTNIWIRFELRITSTRSKWIINEIVNNGYENLSSIIFTLLNGFVSYKVKNKSFMDNKKNWKTWRSWERFMSGVENVKVKREVQNVSSISIKKKWSENSVAKSDMLIFASNPNYFMDWKSEAMQEKIEKLTSQDLAMINNERKELELSQFKTLKELKEFLLDNLIM